MELDDAAVVQEILQGRRERFSLLLERYQRPIFNFIYRFFGSYELAEELTQETFLRCYQFLKSYDRSRKFSTWLYTVAKNLCIDHLKKQKAAREISLDQALPAVEKRAVDDLHLDDPQLLCLRSEQGERVLKGLGGLDAGRRMVLVLYYFQGLSYQEIAETLEVPVSTVKIRIFRAKKSLLALLEEDGKGDE